MFILGINQYFIKNFAFYNSSYSIKLFREKNIKNFNFIVTHSLKN